MLTEGFASELAAIALGHVERAYPHKLDHVLDGPESLAGPEALHPIFFGSFDWHSSVHTYWTLARLLRRFPAKPCASAIRALFDRRLVPEAVASECVYFARPASRGFERPYGWAWLLALAAELQHHAEPAWAAALAPLAALIADRFRAFLPIADYPVRAGTHGNTAFALRLAADYADAVSDDTFRTLLAETAWRWYGADRACQAWEPGGDEFLSPTLVEAECLRRLLAPEAFGSWFDGFLPDFGRGEPATLFRPARPGDRSDGKLAHLDGFNLSRAWCWRSLRDAIPDAALQRRIDATVAAHCDAGLPALTAHYMGEHWLASFALLALDGL